MSDIERLRAGWAQDERSLRESDEENERLRAQTAAAEQERDNAHLDAIGLREEVRALRAEHDQLREARRRKLADLKAHARKLELHLQSLALETLTPVGHDDTVKALARGALAYLDAAPELPEVDDG
jgi:predicted RNase H-like nuclease (RuvC/YqgF family)